MGRKNVVGPYLLFNDVDISTDQTSNFTSIEFLDNCGILCHWTGTSPVGEIIIEVSSDASNNSSTFTPTNWFPLDFGTAITVSGNDDTANINMNQLPYVWLRARYSRTSGTGNLTMTLFTKMVG